MLLAAAGDCPHGVEIVALVGERLQEQVQRFGPHQGRTVDRAFTEVEDAVDDSIRGFEVLVEVDGRFGDDSTLLRVDDQAGDGLGASVDAQILAHRNTPP